MNSAPCGLGSDNEFSALWLGSDSEFSALWLGSDSEFNALWLGEIGIFELVLVIRRESVSFALGVRLFP